MIYKLSEKRNTSTFKILSEAFGFYDQEIKNIINCKSHPKPYKFEIYDQYLIKYLRNQFQNKEWIFYFKELSKENYPHIRILKIDFYNFNAEKVKQIILKCPNLIQIQLLNCRTQNNTKELLQILQKCVPHVKIHLGFGNYSEFDKSCDKNKYIFTMFDDQTLNKLNLNQLICCFPIIYNQDQLKIVLAEIQQIQKIINLQEFQLVLLVQKNNINEQIGLNYSEIGKCISKFLNLKTFRLCLFSGKRENFTSLFQGIQSSQSIQYLHLSLNVSHCIYSPIEILNGIMQCQKIIELVLNLGKLEGVPDLLPQDFAIELNKLKNLNTLLICQELYQERSNIIFERYIKIYNIKLTTFVYANNYKQFFDEVTYQRLHRTKILDGLYGIGDLK